MPVAQYRIKEHVDPNQIVVEAAQVNTNDYDDMVDILKWSNAEPLDSADGKVMLVEGSPAGNGDWVVKSRSGTFYVMGPVFGEMIDPL